MGTETADYYARLDEVDAAQSAGDLTAELLATKRALTAAMKLANVGQQDGNSVNWSNVRDGLQARIKEIEKDTSASTGIQRTKVKYIRATDC